MELMIGKHAAEMTTGSGQGVHETVAGIVKTVGAEDSFEAAFIETGIVGHERDVWETVGFEGGQDAVFNLVPHIWEKRGVFRVVGTQAMNLLAKPGVVVWVGMDETVEGIHHFPIPHDDYAHCAYAAGTAVCRFKIQYNTVLHNGTNIGISIGNPPAWCSVQGVKCKYL